MLSAGQINSAKIKRQNLKILKKNNYCCYICKILLVENGQPTKEFSIDHVESRGLGGQNNFDNKKPCCKTCNQNKSVFENYFLTNNLTKKQLRSLERSWSYFNMTLLKLKFPEKQYSSYHE